MKTWIVSTLAVLLVGATGISCNVNDYCLGCETGGDGGQGSGNMDGGIDSGSGDMPDAGCVPTGPEECDGKDNDCNGFIDDGNNLPGVGDPCTNQNGACSGGKQICLNGALKCDKAPAPETCNKIDDNCSGAVDEGDPGGGGRCGTDEGACIAGQMHCDPATGTVKCFGFIDHTGDTELCNQIDDDCDGVIDDNVPSAGACGPVAIGNVGKCKVGHLECKPGGVTTCDDAVFPAFETCNSTDDDCDSKVDEIFDLKHDIKNCGTCNTVCPTGMNANATCAPPVGNPNGNGQCGLSCKPGYKDLDGQPGCEFGPCFATGDEVCDGDDNDCDGKIDESLTPPAICKSGGECGTTAPTAVCNAAAGWTCTYTGAVQFPETLCDGKDNNCDGNIDENQPNKGQTCHEDSETTCNETSPTTLAIGDNDGDGKVNDGCVRRGAASETGAQCDDLIDNDGDGFVNDGCPAVARQGACRGTGTYVCDTRAGSDPNGPAICNITQAGLPQPAAFETCDFADNDCDGNVDEGANTGNLAGQEWVDIGNNRQIQKYEASRADATPTATGSSPTTVCSRAGVQPWINVKYPDAVAACASIGATLCSEQEWHRTCSSVDTPTYPIAYNASGLYIDAEAYETISSQPVAETTCGSDQVDNDNDGVINDGCAVVGTAETKCHDGVDDDGDGAINDGCPAVGQAWTSNYTTGFTGISDMQASGNLGNTISLANAPTQSPRMTYRITGAPATYHVWVKLNSSSASDDTIHVRVVGATTFQATPTTNGGTAANNNVWKWIDAGAVNIAGAITVNIYMAEDGMKIDRLYIGTAAAPGTGEPASSAGNTWAFSAPKNPNVYETDICNGHDYRTVNITSATRSASGVATINVASHPFVVGDLVQIQGAGDSTLNGVYTISTTTATTFTYTQTTSTAITTAVNGGTATEARDPLLATGALGQACSATIPTGNVFDMSGNVREWTLAHTPGENPIKGGASNGTAQGISCALNFTLGDDTFFFPNVGFRCCRTKP